MNNTDTVNTDILSLNRFFFNFRESSALQKRIVFYENYCGSHNVYVLFIAGAYDRCLSSFSIIQPRFSIIFLLDYQETICGKVWSHSHILSSFSLAFFTDRYCYMRREYLIHEPDYIMLNASGRELFRVLYKV